MFTKQESQVVVNTLTHRRDWLLKNIESSEPGEARSNQEQTLQLLEGALRKLTDSAPEETLSSTPKENPASTIAAHRAQLAPDKIKVLIVDDDTLITTLLSTYLVSMGIQKISIAEDGQRAITMLYDAQPIYDLVLCDWNMPIKSGLDVHNAMRASERYQDTCFMLATANSEAKQIRAAIEEGVDDYLVKPIEQAVLSKKIARFFPLVASEQEPTKSD